MAAVFLALIDPAKAAEILKALDAVTASLIIEAMVTYDPNGPGAKAAADIMAILTDTDPELAAEILKRLSFETAARVLEGMGVEKATESIKYLDAREIAPLLPEANLDFIVEVLSGLDADLLGRVALESEPVKAWRIFARLISALSKGVFTTSSTSPPASNVNRTIDPNIAALSDAEVEGMKTNMVVHLPSEAGGKLNAVEAKGGTIGDLTFFVADVEHSQGDILPPGNQRATAVEVDGKLSYRLVEADGTIVDGIELMFDGGHWSAMVIPENPDAVVEPATGMIHALNLDETVESYLADLEKDAAETITFLGDLNALALPMLSDADPAPDPDPDPPGPVAHNALKDIKELLPILAAKPQAGKKEVKKLLRLLNTLSPDQAKHISMAEKITISELLYSVKLPFSEIPSNVERLLATSYSSKSSSAFASLGEDREIKRAFLMQRIKILTALGDSDIFEKMKSWDQSSVEERKTLARELFAAATNSFGLTLTDLKFSYLETTGIGGSHNHIAAYHVLEDEVHIDLTALAMSPVHIMTAIVHELTHAWQVDLVRRFADGKVKKDDSWYRFAHLLSRSFRFLTGVHQEAEASADRHRGPVLKEYFYTWHEVHAHSVGYAVGKRAADEFKVSYHELPTGAFIFDKTPGSYKDTTPNELLTYLYTSNDLSPVISDMEAHSAKDNAELLLAIYKEFGADMTRRILTGGLSTETITELVREYDTEELKSLGDIFWSSDVDEKLRDIIKAIGFLSPEVMAKVLFSILAKSSESTGNPDLTTLSTRLRDMVTEPALVSDVLTELDKLQAAQADAPSSVTEPYSLSIMAEIISDAGGQLSDDLRTLVSALLLRNELLEADAMEAFLIKLSPADVTAVEDLMRDPLRLSSFTGGSLDLALMSLGAIDTPSEKMALLKAAVDSGTDSEKATAFTLLLISTDSSEIFASWWFGTNQPDPTPKDVGQFMLDSLKYANPNVVNDGYGLGVIAEWLNHLSLTLGKPDMAALILFEIGLLALDTKKSLDIYELMEKKLPSGVEMPEELVDFITPIKRFAHLTL
ncbi:MAG: hypothetical protein AAFZ92_02920 [Pseudomonadota bacterium]